MSDFPRGWTLATDNAGAAGAATITVAAIAGVVHVLDAFAAKAVNATAGASGAQILLSSSDGVFANFPLARLFAPANGTDSDGGSGLDLAAGPGASLTIAFSIGLTSFFEQLRVQGHDI